MLSSRRAKLETKSLPARCRSHRDGYTIGNLNPRPSAVESLYEGRQEGSWVTQQKCASERPLKRWRPA
jgi:hypothetical protein